MIIRTLQLYKPSWQILLNKKIHLGFQDGEIQVLVGYPDEAWSVDKEVVHNFNFASPLLPSEFHKKVEAWQTIKKVDTWMDLLNIQEREALFWRFINHDFELPSLQQEMAGLYYKTLSEREIASKMKISRTKLRDLIDEAFNKIYKFEGEGKDDYFQVNKLSYREYNLRPN